jgi:hypothetical protein
MLTQDLYSTAAVNLGRSIQTIQCRVTGDKTSCLLNSSILVQGEICGGILVATLPLLGPLWKSRRRKPTKQSMSGGTPGKGPFGPFQTIGSIPLKNKNSKGLLKEDSLLGIQNDNTGAEWQEQTVTTAHSVASTPRENTGNQWRADMEGGHGHYIQNGDTVTSQGAIVEKMEYAVDEWRHH